MTCGCGERKLAGRSSERLPEHLDRDLVRHQGVVSPMARLLQVADERVRRGVAAFVVEAIPKVIQIGGAFARQTRPRTAKATRHANSCQNGGCLADRPL